jgi:hypothetical protein
MKKPFPSSEEEERRLGGSVDPIDYGREGMRLRVQTYGNKYLTSWTPVRLFSFSLWATGTIFPVI